MDSWERARILVQRWKRDGRGELDALEAMVREALGEHAHEEKQQRMARWGGLSQDELAQIEGRLAGVPSQDFDFEAVMRPAPGRRPWVVVCPHEMERGEAEALVAFVNGAASDVSRLLTALANVSNILLDDRLAEMAAFEEGRKQGMKEKGHR